MCTITYMYNIWPYMTLNVKYIWPYMTIYVQYMTIYDHISTIYDHIWPYMVIEYNTYMCTMWIVSDVYPKYRQLLLYTTITKGECIHSGQPSGWLLFQFFVCCAHVVVWAQMLRQPDQATMWGHACMQMAHQTCHLYSYAHPTHILCHATHTHTHTHTPTHTHTLCRL